MTTLYLRPADPAFVIRDPVNPSRLLPPHGAAVTDGMTWRRRLARGEVVATTRAAIVAAETGGKAAAPPATSDPAKAPAPDAE